MIHGIFALNRWSTHKWTTLALSWLFSRPLKAEAIVHLDVQATPIASFKPVSDLNSMHQCFLSSLEWFWGAAKLENGAFKVNLALLCQTLESSRMLFTCEIFWGASIEAVLVSKTRLGLKCTHWAFPWSLSLSGPMGLLWNHGAPLSSVWKPLT